MRLRAALCKEQCSNCSSNQVTSLPRPAHCLDKTMTQFRSSCTALLLLAACLLSTAGCGGPGHDRTEVSGLVTLNGKPLPSGLTVKFTPQEEGLPVASGWTNPDSTYAVYAEPGKIGLNPGTYTVSVELPFADEPGPYSGPPELANIKIPKSFQTGSSTLMFSVPGGGTTLDIQMTGK